MFIFKFKKSKRFFQEREMSASLERLSVFESDLSLLDVDKGVVTVELPVHRQIVDAFVQDSAIDDVIYVLGEALRLGHLPWDVYLKKVRNLSRKQFFLRALMIKCRERAGLVDSA
jgi:ESCRT-I complex subunit TSG101